MSPRKHAHGLRRWPLERILFLLAGTMTLIGVVGGLVLSPWLWALPAFVAVNQIVFVVIGACPASLILERVGATAVACPSWR